MSGAGWRKTAAFNTLLGWGKRGRWRYGDTPMGFLIMGNKFLIFRSMKQACWMAEFLFYGYYIDI